MFILFLFKIHFLYNFSFTDSIAMLVVFFSVWNFTYFITWHFYINVCYLPAQFFLSIWTRFKVEGNQYKWQQHFTHQYLLDILNVKKVIYTRQSFLLKLVSTLSRFYFTFLCLGFYPSWEVKLSCTTNSVWKYQKILMNIL